MSLSLSLTRRSASTFSTWLNQVLYVDHGVVVLNKPPGLICQLDRTKSSTGSSESSFSKCLAGLQQSLALDSMPYPIHRLDKGTTGTLLLARTLPSARALSQQFQQGTVEKTYLALVRGGKKTFPINSGIIKIPLQFQDGRVSLSTTRYGKPSVTEWELVGSSPVAPLSLLRMRLLTGHKHQLRVQLSRYLQAPILGDDLYSKTEPSAEIVDSVQLQRDRIYLHAYELSFFKYRPSGPHKRFRLGIRAPLPEDFVRICTNAQISLNSISIEGGIFVNGNFVQDGRVSEVGGYWYKYKHLMDA
ncbi:hypothetical protein AMATHDRAFT_6747 [Amanita thiersii Skay4041]|uniref:Pseudouridine synthase RsuA/RluA-like domain-containing protein n=1 Tax=Amanita thiersii Skay4041 TaxID=703135 RepID=A0A2A9N968_9AGAR|nr:hypothetical protein AMATHDRAFT_6747 [Amanita thiersii Skay4041]